MSKIVKENVKLYSKSQLNKNVHNRIQNLALLRTKTTQEISVTRTTTPQLNTDNSEFCHGIPTIILPTCSNIPNNNVSSMVFSNVIDSSNLKEIPALCDMPSTYNTTNSFVNKLKFWSINRKVPHSTLEELLCILRQVDDLSDLKQLPKDPRTLLSTPKSTIFRNVVPGQYYHFGLKNGLENIFKHIDVSYIMCEQIEVGINIDGLPISKSSTSQLYPILCLIQNIDILPNIFPIGIYHGYDKPADFNNFIEDFVNEAILLTINGIILNGKTFKFKISMFLFDAVAKSSVLYIKGHSGYSSCSKCCQEGEYIKDRVCFPDIDFVKRTHLDFILQTDDQHHVGQTILKNIPNIDLILDVPLDYMHLILLGVVKKLLVNTWCFGRPPHKIQIRIFNEISQLLIKLIPYIPIEFSRKPRTLKESKRYKATEFRLFILYTGVVVLRDYLPKNKYEHFLTLHVAVTILLSNFLIKDYINYAEDLLKHFVTCSKIIYGLQFLSHNIHNLLHISDDARKFGSLEKFCNFSSENYLQKLKKIIRKPDDILPQIVRRLTEENSVINTVFKQTKNTYTPILQKEHNNGPLLNNISNLQYQEAIFLNFKLKLNNQDRCCKLVCGTIIEIFNFETCHLTKNNCIIGKKYNIALVVFILNHVHRIFLVFIM